MTRIFAAPTTRWLKEIWRAEGDGTQDWAFDLQTALNRAQAGDEIVLLPGRFVSPAVLTRSGRKQAPITIEPLIRDTVILDGERSPRHAAHAGYKPLDGDFAMLKLFDVAHIRIKGLRFERCWPVGIYMRSARHIVIEDCKARDGRFFIYLRQHDNAPTHHITLDRCDWVQDPEHEMRRGTLTWSDVKNAQNKGARPVIDASYLNGAFLGGFDVQGQIIVRNCRVAHAFNVIRLDMRPKHVRAGPLANRNRDVAIYDSSFAFIRDNLIEPEKGAQNWRVFNNRIYCAHAAFSLDRVVGRDLFFVGNTILNDHRPGVLGKAFEDDINDNQGGRIFKFLKTGTTPGPVARKGVYALHNSILTRTAYMKKTMTSDLTDMFTLLGVLPSKYPQADHPPRDPFQELDWDHTRIAGMISDAEGFPDAYGAPRGALSGTKVDQVFETPASAQPDDPVWNDWLGGWTGELIPTPAVAVHSSEAFAMHTLDGEIALGGGLPLGAVDVDDLGLGHWRDPWPNSPVS